MSPNWLTIGSLCGQVSCWSSAPTSVNWFFLITTIKHEHTYNRMLTSRSNQQLLFLFNFNKDVQMQVGIEQRLNRRLYVHKDVSYECVHYCPLRPSGFRTGCDYNLFANLCYRFTPFHKHNLHVYCEQWPRTALSRFTGFANISPHLYGWNAALGHEPLISPPG